MPTYMLLTHPQRLTAQQRADVAEGLSHSHGRATGAPVSFVRCIFQDINADGHFIGGRPAPTDGIWVYGHIRGGRTPEMKNRLILGIRDHLAQVACIDESMIWIYLNELTHTNMIEFGHILPEQGREQEWIENLPTDLRQRLTALG